MDDLSNLIGIQLPAPISWWPLAVGWYYLAAVLLCLFSYYIYKKHRHYQQQAYRRDAVKAVSLLTVNNTAMLLPIIKRVLKSSVDLFNTANPKQTLLAELVSETDWFTLFNRSSLTPIFNEGDWENLLLMTYQSPSRHQLQQVTFDELKAKSIHWIKVHQI